MRFDEELHAATLRRRLPPPRERRGLRLSKGISLRAIAERCGVSDVTALRWERGDRTPKGQDLRDYLETLGLLRG